jgi:hypothetical protein
MEKSEGEERLGETKETHGSLIMTLLSISSENVRNQQQKGQDSTQKNTK